MKDAFFVAFVVGAAKPKGIAGAVAAAVPAVNFAACAGDRSFLFDESFVFQFFLAIDENN